MWEAIFTIIIAIIYWAFFIRQPFNPYTVINDKNEPQWRRDVFSEILEQAKQDYLNEIDAPMKKYIFERSLLIKKYLWRRLSIEEWVLSWSMDGRFKGFYILSMSIYAIIGYLIGMNLGKWVIIFLAMDWAYYKIERILTSTFWNEDFINELRDLNDKYLIE